MRPDRRRFRKGEHVRIDGDVGAERESDGRPVTFRGDRGVVAATNPTYIDQDGVRRVCVETETGDIIAAPTKAVAKLRRRTVVQRP